MVKNLKSRVKMSPVFVSLNQADGVSTATGSPDGPLAETVARYDALEGVTPVHKQTSGGEKHSFIYRWLRISEVIAVLQEPPSRKRRSLLQDICKRWGVDQKRIQKKRKLCDMESDLEEMIVQETKRLRKLHAQHGHFSGIFAVMQSLSVACLYSNNLKCLH